LRFEFANLLIILTRGIGHKVCDVRIQNSTEDETAIAAPKARLAAPLSTIFEFSRFYPLEERSENDQMDTLSPISYLFSSEIGYQRENTAPVLM
jgi:hypothetical protein